WNWGKPMTLSRLETERIARSANGLRPDWPIKSLETFIWQNLKHHAYRDVAIVLNIVATDPLTENPGRVLEAGPWWKATQLLGGPHAAWPRAHPQRAAHGGCPSHEDHPVGADLCPDCRQSLVTDPTRSKTLADQVKAAHRAARAARPAPPEERT